MEATPETDLETAAAPTKALQRISLGAAVGLAVFLVALAIRMIGIGWGLKNDLHNASYHPDEPLIFGESRQIVPGQGQFVPHFYNYGTLYLTLLRVASDMTTTYTGAPKVRGDGFSFSNPDLTDWDWVSRCHLVGRFLSALAGAGTALIVFLIGRRSFGLWAGAIAGAVIAVAPAHVVHSRFQTVDILATFFLTCSLWYAVKIATSSSPQQPQSTIHNLQTRTALWCGLFAGLSAGTKYTGILAVLSLVAALWVAKPKDWPKALAIGLGAALLAFLVTTPGVLLDTSKFLQDTSYEMAHTSSEHGLLFVNTPSGFMFHAANLVLGIGPMIVILGLAGLGWAAYRRHAWALVLLAFFVPYYLLIGKAEVKFVRYTFPLYPALAVGFGYAMVAAHRRGGLNRAVVGLGILGLGGVPLGGLLDTSQYTLAMAGKDPRDAAAEYLREKGGTVGLAKDPWFWTPPLFPDVAEPRAVSWQRRLAQMQSANPPIAYVSPPDGPSVVWDSRLVTDVKPPHIEISSFELDPVFRLKGAKGLESDKQAEVDADSHFLDVLDQRYEPEIKFGPSLALVEDLMYVRPTVYLSKPKQSP